MANIGVNATPTTYKSWANGYKKIVDVTYKKGKDYRDGVFMVDTTENWEDRLVEMGGIDEFSVWNDGERASQSEILEGYDKRFTQVPFGKEVPFGRLFKKFMGKDAKLTKKAMRELGNKAYRLEQKSAFSHLGYAFADTNSYLTGVTGSSVSALGPDGKRFASVAHPCGPDNATTWSNALADNNVVGEEALKLHIENLHNQLDMEGEKMFLGEAGYIWLVTFEDLPEALRVVGSEQRNDTANNDTNVYNGKYDGRPIEVRMVPWLSSFGSTRNNFLVAKDMSVEDNRVVLNSIPFTPDDYVDNATKTAYVRGELAFSTGFLSGRGVSCSQGTGVGTYTA